jgi:hypothetical protein
MEVVQLVTWILYTVGAIQYFSIGTTSSYVAHTAITKLYFTDCQATTAIDIFNLEVVLKLLAPFFGNLGPGIVVVSLCRFIRRTLVANKPTVSHYFLHISSLPSISAVNGARAAVY